MDSACFLALTLTACDQGDYCADVVPNATVIDVRPGTAARTGAPGAPP